jgi:hypothetical protein
MWRIITLSRFGTVHYLFEKVCKLSAGRASEQHSEGHGFESRSGCTWKNKINNVSFPSINGRYKLRSYRVFKHDYDTEMYVSTSNFPAKHRSPLAKFRYGVAPICLESGTI